MKWAAEFDADYLIETTNWWALTGLGECGGGPATTQIATPVKTAARNVGIAIAFC
jgi:hypothetical protein